MYVCLNGKNTIYEQTRLEMASLSKLFAGDNCYSNVITNSYTQ